MKFSLSNSLKKISKKFEICIASIIEIFFYFRSFLIQFKIFMITRNIKSQLQVKSVPTCSKLAFLATRQLSKAMTHMSESFMAIGDLESAQLAAFWSLEKSMQFRNFREISKSCSNVLNVIHRINCSDKYCWLIRGMFEQICRSLFLSYVNVEGLFSTMRVYEHSMKCL